MVMTAMAMFQFFGDSHLRAKRANGTLRAEFSSVAE